MYYDLAWNPLTNLHFCQGSSLLNSSLYNKISLHSLDNQSLCIFLLSWPHSALTEVCDGCARAQVGPNRWATTQQLTSCARLLPWDARGIRCYGGVPPPHLNPTQPFGSRPGDHHTAPVPTRRRPRISRQLLIAPLSPGTQTKQRKYGFLWRKRDGINMLTILSCTNIRYITTKVKGLFKHCNK